MESLILQAAITLTVSQTDKVSVKRDDGKVADDEIDLDAVPEPVKVAKKKEVAAPSAEADLASIVDDWDD